MRDGMRWLIGLLLVLASCLQTAYADDEFLPPEQAFRFSARMADANKDGQLTAAERKAHHDQMRAKMGGKHGGHGGHGDMPTPPPAA